LPQNLISPIDGRCSRRLISPSSSTAIFKMYESFAPGWQDTRGSPSDENVFTQFGKTESCDSSTRNSSGNTRGSNLAKTGIGLRPRWQSGCSDGINLLISTSTGHLDSPAEQRDAPPNRPDHGLSDQVMRTHPHREARSHARWPICLQSGPWSNLAVRSDLRSCRADCLCRFLVVKLTGK